MEFTDLKIGDKITGDVGKITPVTVEIVDINTIIHAVKVKYDNGHIVIFQRGFLEHFLCDKFEDLPEIKKQTTFKFYPYVGGSMDDSPQEFSTLEELIKLPQVQKFKGEALAISEGKNYLGQPSLMAVTDNGHHWWVIGRLDENLKGIKLPYWEIDEMPNPLIIVE